MTNIKEYIVNRDESNWRIRGVGFFLSFLILLIVSIKDNVTVYVADSYYYWTIGDGIWNNELGRINFLSFPETFRGYFYPFLLSTIKMFSEKIGIDAFLMYRILSSLVFAFFIAIILPYLIEKSLCAIRYMIGILGITLFTCIFWKDFLEYPFSDAPAMILFMIACAVGKFLLRQFEEKKRNKFYLFGGAFLLGILLYGAYNTRLIYLYAGIVLVICLVCGVWKIIFGMEEKGAKRNIACISAGMIIFTILGSLLVAFPQMKINNQYIGKYTPRILSEQLFGYKANLNIYQLIQGIRLERCDAVIHEESASAEAIIFLDSAGVQIIDVENSVILNEMEKFGIADLLKLYFKYPFDIIGIYAGHILSYITVIYEGFFIHDLNQIDKFAMILNMVLWITGGLALAEKKWSVKGIWNKRFLLFAVIPCILLVAGAPELRFFIALHFILYSFIAFEIDYMVLGRYIKKHWAKVSIAVLMIVCVWFMYIGNLLSEINANTYLIR